MRDLRFVALLVFAAFGSSSVRAGEAHAQVSAPPPLGETESSSDAQLERARVKVAIAEGLFAAGHYAAALAEYTRAYDILQGHPRQYWVLHNLAACNERLFRYDTALELYEEYLRRAPRDEPDRAGVHATIVTLRTLLATLVVRAEAPADVWLDDRRLGAAPGRWRVPAGRHIVELRADLHQPQRHEVQLGAGQVLTLHARLQRLSTYRGPAPVYFWTATGLSAGAAVAGASFGLMALSSRRQGEARAELSLDASEHADRTERRALAADAFFGASVLFAATATVLFFVTDWSDGAKEQRRQSAGLRSVDVGRSSLRARF